MFSSGIHHHIFEIDSTLAIIAVSAAKSKGMCCFFDCHGNNLFKDILIATQEYYYPRKCELAMLMIL